MSTVKERKEVNKLGLLIKEFANANSLTLLEFGNRMEPKASSSALAQIMRSTRPHGKTVGRVADVLGMERDELLEVVRTNGASTEVETVTEDGE